MGTFTVGCLIKNHVDREKAVKIPRLMVDAKRSETWISRNLLEQIEIKPEKSRTFVLPDGKCVCREIGYAIVCVPDRETADEVVFAEESDDESLGSRALTGLMLCLDKKNKKLRPIDASPVLLIGKDELLRVPNISALKSGTRRSSSFPKLEKVGEYA